MRLPAELPKKPSVCFAEDDATANDDPKYSGFRFCNVDITASGVVYCAVEYEVDG